MPRPLPPPSPAPNAIEVDVQNDPCSGCTEINLQHRKGCAAFLRSDMIDLWGMCSGFRLKEKRGGFLCGACIALLALGHGCDFLGVTFTVS